MDLSELPYSNETGVEFIATFWAWDHSSIKSSKRWVGGVRKWQFLMIYSTENHHRVGWVAYKSQKNDDVILEWSP